MITYDNIVEYIDAGKSPAEILVELQSQVNIVENKTAWTIGLMQSEIGPDLTYMVAEIIKNAGETNPVIYSAFIALSTVGLQLYTPDRQAMIEMLGAGNLTAEQIATVKSLGVVSTPKYTDLTEQDVLDCIAAHEAELEQQALEQLRMATWEAWNSAYNANVSTVLDGEAPTVANLIAGLQAAIAELEA
jgi:uncharacterized protein (DUF433 family)